MGGVSKLFIARDMEIQATKRFDPFPIVVVDFEQMTLVGRAVWFGISAQVFAIS